MKRPALLLPLFLLPLVGTLRAGEAVTGPRRASATARVTISLPSLHGIDVPSDVPSEVDRPSAVQLAVFRRGSTEAVPFSLIGTDPGGMWHVFKAVSPPNSRLAAFSSTRAPDGERQVEIFSRTGASGWLNLRDHVGAPAVSFASRSDERPRLTLVYEAWHF